MRGSGYAVGEILIFLAIAGIIGFLVGWVVFYRRSDRSGTELSEANPNHVRQLETRTRAAESKLGRIEKRATALLDTLEKRGAAAGTAAATGPQDSSSGTDAKIAPAAAAPEGAGKHGPRAGDAAPPDEQLEAAPISVESDVPEDEADQPTEGTDESGTGDAAPEEENGEPEADAAASSEGQAAASETADQQEAEPAPVEDGGQDETEAAADTATESVDEDEKAAPPADDEDLGDAADRLAKLEATLDKLSEKLAELDEE